MNEKYEIELDGVHTDERKNSSDFIDVSFNIRLK